jgi:hypothetical protein
MEALRFDGALESFVVSHARHISSLSPSLRFIYVLFSFLFCCPDTGQETKIEVRPVTDFSYSVAKSKLISVYINAKQSGRGSEATRRISSCMDDSNQREAQLHLSNAIDLQSTESVRGDSIFRRIETYITDKVVDACRDIC